MADQDKNRSIAGCLAIAFLVLVAIFGVVLYGLNSGRLASTAALPQSKIPPNQLKEIGQIVNLKSGENILYFYSSAMTVSGDGNLFTNERVISYTSDSNSTRVIDATYDKIEDIVFNPSNSILDDSTITITLQDGSTFDLWVSTESGRDQEFYDRLVQEWQRHRN